MTLPKMGSSRLLELINLAGLTQAEFARRLGVSKTFIVKVIRGEKKFSYERAYQASIILNCRMEELHYWIY